MTGDFTRETFHPENHYSRVLFQQGRVSVDADPNEQTAILLHTIRTLARDLIGPYAAPLLGGGFQITPDLAGGFMIGRGRYYVDGILVENEADCWYNAQPDYPLAPDDLVLAETGKPSGKVLFLYLDVWERVITPIQDGLIREVALGGPDTALRAKTVWQVRALDTGLSYQGGKQKPFSLPACGAPLAKLPALSLAQLAARIDPGDVPDDPCILAPSAKYRGAENQLYRVQIHDGGTAGKATFKWSRDNGSRVTAWIGSFGDQLQVADSRLFDAGCWVEMTDDVLDLHGLPGVLVRVAKVTPGALTLDPASVDAATPYTASLVNPKLRRWDQVERGETVLRHGAVPISEGVLAKGYVINADGRAGMKSAEFRDARGWLNLEDGVQIAFSPDGVYRSGDYWEIPARVATGDVEWPRAMINDTLSPAPLPPMGVEHHYAPLGYLAFFGETFRFQSCRCEFDPGSSCLQTGSLAIGASLLRDAATRVAAAAAQKDEAVAAAAPVNLKLLDEKL